MLLIVTVLVVVAILLLIIYKKTQEPDDTTPTLTSNVIPTLSNVCQSQIDADVSLDPNSNCIFSPVNGTCIVADTKLENGCCVLDLPPELSKYEGYMKMAAGIMAVVGAGMAADFVIAAPVNLLFSMKRFTTAAASRTSSVGTRRGARTIISEALERMFKKILATRASKMMMNMSTKMSRGANIASAILTAIDIADPYGYSTFISNSYLKDMRDTVEFYTETACKENEQRYPLMFDVNWVFGSQYDEAYTICAFNFLDKATRDFVTCTGGEVNDDTFVEIFIMALGYMNEVPVERDTFIYNKMKFLYPEIQDYIALYESMSTTNESGVSLSASGVEYYTGLTNEQKLQKLKEATMFMQPIYDDESADSLMTYIESFVIGMTKYYRIHDVDAGCREPHREIVDYIMDFGLEFMSIFNPKYGKDCIPVMATRELDAEIPMMLPNLIKTFCDEGAPPLIPDVPECESYDPGDYNVGFNKDRNLCKYTREYCDKMALDYDSATEDCKWYPGQEAVELFLPTGTTLTRNVIRYGNSINSCDNEEIASNYDNIHDCRFQEVTQISRSVEKLDSLKDCDENWRESGYRSKEACEFARTGSFVSTVVPFTGMFFDCSEGLLKSFVNEAYAAGEGVEQLFQGNPAYFEDKSQAELEGFENRGNAIKNIFTTGGSDMDYATAFTGSTNENNIINAMYISHRQQSRERSQRNQDFLIGQADYENPAEWVQLAVSNSGLNIF